MKRTALCVLVLALAALSIACGGGGNDGNAGASFSGVDDSDMPTFIGIFAGDSKISVKIFQCPPEEEAPHCSPGDAPGKPCGDPCTKFSGIAEFEPQDFEINRGLTLAAFNSVVGICSSGSSSDCHEFTFDLTWIGVGDLSISRRENQNETIRSAEVTGSMTVDGTHFTMAEDGRMTRFESRGGGLTAWLVAVLAAAALAGALALGGAAWYARRRWTR